MTGLDYTRIIRRILQLMGGLTLAGSLLWYLFGGQGALVSFLGGAAISGLSFWLLHRLVSDIGRASEGQKVRGPSVLLHAFRMLLLGGAAYAIVRSYGSHGPALVTGLTIAVTAATLEVLIELTYAS
ncbi:MAG: ATP synthase subunit I [Acidobacteria bacterium]|nr:ATP synthase subunit I [Acidobacteriota bacterium]